MRTLLTFIVFFAVGLATAAGYFYGRHPEHSPVDDVPQLRRDVENMIDRGHKLREAWEAKPAEAVVQPPPEGAPGATPEKLPPKAAEKSAPKSPREKTKKKSVEK
ncbi:MAG: hypothetical protein IT462_00280 [Planctomycetes bacterium]|nr:hypothetical protein [Planctomycetota bacterium]